MGGLVFKKAYILGQNDPQYRDIVESIRSVIFLSTPHRGTNLAELLNKILAVSVFNHSAKHYITELQKNSPTLQDINEQFRNFAPKLQLFSLYETQPTPIGPKKLTVLEKDSSILGYPNEVSKALDADHHNVCKYTDVKDPNYVSVRNILKSLLGRYSVQREAMEHDDNAPFEDQRLGKFLGITASPDEDYDFFYSRWMPGSCEWIRSDESFKSWMGDNKSKSRVLWLQGVPGAGKSVLASYLIRHLEEVGVLRQFFFFKHGEQTKRSIHTFLRSLAYQIASEVPEYRTLLSKMAGDVNTLEKAEARSLWQKLFKTGLLTLRLSQPLYWVVDALDECDTPQQLINMLSDITTSQTSIRILLVSRRTQALALNLQRIAERLNVDVSSVDNPASDLRQYVAKEMEYVPGRPDFKREISERILEKADGNFLWVHLVVMSITRCHTEIAIEEALDELPADLEPLYQRMESALARSLRPRDQSLAKTILTWAACSRRSLTITELAEALRPAYPNFIDLGHTVMQLCGGFVIIDSKGHISMIHQTAREYLTKTPGMQHSISPRIAHRELFLKCIEALSSTTRRAQSAQLSSHPFIIYAATSWFYHLSLSVVLLDHLQTLILSKFFQGPSVLDWIHTLALTGQLQCLVRSSQSIMSYLGKQTRIAAESSPLSHRLHEKEHLESWATDLIKIVGKFRTNLLRHPRSIYKLIPAFCPKGSMIHRQFGPKSLPGSLEVTGISNTDWDDCLAKFQVDRDTQALRVVCGEKFFAILTSDGRVALYHTATCEEVRTFTHKERVICFGFDRSWHRLVTYGLRTTKVWDVRSGNQSRLLPNPSNAKALAISFLGDTEVIVSCSDDRSIRQAILEPFSGSWTMLESTPGGSGFQGKIFNSPRRVAFSPDGLQVAIAYRGFPLLVFSLNPLALVGHCERLTDRTKRSQDLWTDVGPICWNPMTGHVLGLYNDGCVFKWDPLEPETYELNTVATDLQCSPNGNIFVTSSVDGTLRIWNFHHFALIYTLSCHTPVTSLAVSADGGRIYDLRDSFCHVWEPNALIRLAEVDDETSDTSSTLGGLPQASEVSSEMLPPITALAVCSRDATYCVGDDTGSLRLYRQNDGCVTNIARTFMPITHAAWIEDKLSLITADLGGMVSVWSEDTSKYTKSMQLNFKANIGRSIRQILPSYNLEYFLAITNESIELWSLITKSKLVSHSSLTTFSHWAHHPLEDALVLEIETTKINVYSWEKLAVVGSVRLYTQAAEVDIEWLRIENMDTPNENERPGMVPKLLMTSDRSKVLLQDSQKVNGRWRKNQVKWIASSQLPIPPSDAEDSVIKANKFPKSIDSRIESLIGVVAPSSRRGSLAGVSSGDILVFLDHESWICSWPINEEEAENNVKRHFFLPQDWLNSDFFQHCAISEDGTLYIPKDGEVAVILNGLREAWLD